jgi:hypothetical protein
MKNINHFTGIILVISGILFSSCSATNMLTMSVTEPAPVYLPSDIKKIGIVNRSIPTDKTEKNLDKIDKILSVEGKNLDRKGAKNSINGVLNELNNNNKLEEIKIIAKPNIKGSAMSVFPSALSWGEVKRICNETNVDALFVLSFYDTDTKVDYKQVPIEIDGPLGVKVPAVEHHANIRTLIKTGWRIYDPVNKIIRDEYIINEQIVSTGKGINPLKAVQAVMGRKEAVLDVSTDIGHHYALRILPYRIRVSRDYYVRGTNNFKVAKRRAQTGDWDGAAELWEMEVSNPDPKIAGRACYNMAIINEINGNLDKAVEWASKAYTDYNDKRALRYLKILKHRIRKNEQLKREEE